MGLAFSVLLTYIYCMPRRGISEADREFLAALGEVVFGNPFSAERAQRIVRLVPDVALGDLDSNREALARVVEPRLEPLLRDGAQALQRLGVEDRRLLELAFLYVCYHRYVPQIDALIERQATQGGPSLAVPFAGEAIAQLSRGHESEERVVRVFGFFCPRGHRQRSEPTPRNNPRCRPEGR